MIHIASDHAGFELKEEIKKFLLERQYEVKDHGTCSEESVAWPSFGARAAGEVSKHPDTHRGIIVCGAGIGMSMVCNKFKNVRAALCHDEYAAEMSRKHNNANVLNMGGRAIEMKKALKILEIWLTTEFEGGRHQKRLDLLSEIENKNFK
jgi:ribose 5-phosphate isomerase B